MCDVTNDLRAGRERRPSFDADGLGRARSKAAAALGIDARDRGFELHGELLAGGDGKKDSRLPAKELSYEADLFGGDRGSLSQVRVIITGFVGGSSTGFIAPRTIRSPP